MNRLKERLQKNQILYFVLITILVVGVIFTVSFSGQMAQWLTPAILTVLSIIATIITSAFAQVVKQKYKINVEQATVNRLEQFTQIKEAIQQVQQQMQMNQKKQFQQIDSKLQIIEKNQFSQVKELRQTIELNKQLAVVKLTEQFEQLMNTTTSNFVESNQELKKVQEAMDASFVKQFAQSTSLQKVVKTMNTELVEHTASQHEQSINLVQQNTLALTEHVNKAVQKSIEQTTSSEKLLTEILTTLARNILSASNMMKDSVSKQHAEALAHIDNIDAKQHKYVQQSFEDLTDRVIYVVDQLNNNSNAVTMLLDEKTKLILADLSDKYSAAAIALKDKATTDQITWDTWSEKSAANFNELFATISKNALDVHQHLKLAHDEQVVNLSKATQTIMDKVQASTTNINTESHAQFEQLKADIQLTSKQQEVILSQTGKQLQQEAATNLVTLQHNISELQQTASQKLQGTKQEILESVNELTAVSTDYHEKALAQVISVESNVAQSFEKLKNATSIQSNSLETKIVNIHQQQTKEQQRQIQQQESYLTSIEKMIDSVQTSLQQPLQKMDEQLIQLQKVELTERQALQSKFQSIESNVNELNAKLLQQLSDVKTEISKNNITTVQNQLKSFEVELSQIKTSVTKSKTDVTKQIQAIEQAVKKDENSNLEFKQILQSVTQMIGQFKEHEALMLKRIDVIDTQLKAMQKVSTSSTTTKSTTTSSTKQAIQASSKPVIEKKLKNRTEVIEDKANDITLHNKFVNGVLKQSDMLQQGKISYTAFYNANGTLEKTLNFDKNGEILTEILYYPNGAVKERTEFVTVKRKRQKEITKFSADGKKLN